MNKSALLELIDYYEKIKAIEGVCPLAHTYMSVHIGVLLDERGDFLAAADFSGQEKLAVVPCTIESEGRTRNIAPHLLSDNLSYVGGLPEYEERFRAYLEQLDKYVKNNPADVYAASVYRYVRKRQLIMDVKELLKNHKYDLKSINISFAVRGLTELGEDLDWTNYYVKLLKKNGICCITGNRDHIPNTYPARITSQTGRERLFLKGCGVGYVASQKIIHALQYMCYACKK